MSASIKYLLFSVLLLYLAPVQAQKESDKLKKQQKELQKRIDNTKKMLGDAQNNQRLTLTELGIVNQQIAYREELLSTYERQIRALNRKIEENKGMIQALQEDTKRLLAQYRTMIVAAYKNRHKHNNLLFIFSSASFNQAYLRIKFMQKVVEYRRRQVEVIRRTQKELARKEEQMRQQITEKNTISSQTAQEREKFNADKRKQQDMLADLKKKESNLRKDLQDAESKKKQLDLAIRKAIEKEIAETTKKNTNLEMTPEAKLAAKNFEANKGRLPWPVERGEITGSFGQVPHPVVKGVIINNNGIDITAPKEASVRAIYEGEVSSILVIPGAGKAVMISHGNYRTVYANLQDVSVQKGDKVDTKQRIGTLLPGDSGSNSVCHFEIWKITGTKSAPQNPGGWIYR
jgi:septal ring factor EnvC (AmiA/AmiB activator)